MGEKELAISAKNMSKKDYSSKIRSVPSVERYINGLKESLSKEELYQAEKEIESVLKYLKDQRAKLKNINNENFELLKRKFIDYNFDKRYLNRLKENQYNYELWLESEKYLIKKSKNNFEDKGESLLVTFYKFNKSEYKVEENKLRIDTCKEVQNKIISDSEEFFEKRAIEKVEKFKSQFFLLLEYLGNKERKWKLIPIKKTKVKGVGFKKELPQKLVKEFLENTIKQESNRRYIHQAGTNEGKPNWSALADGFLEKYNWVEEKKVISKRRLMDRFKMAYDVIERH